MIRLELVDGNGTSVASTELEASRINENGITLFMPGGSSESLNANRIVETNGEAGRSGSIKIEKNKPYTFRLSASGLQSDGEIEIVLSSSAQAGDIGTSDAVIDGQQLNGSCLNMYVTNRVYSYKTIALFLFMILMTLVFVLLPFEKIDAGISKRTGKDEAVFSTWITRAMFMLAPFVAYFIIQKYAEFGLKEFLDQLLSEKGILNMLAIGLIWWLIYTVSNRVRISSALTVLAASLFGFTNYMLIQFREYPLMATDIAQLGTALQVADSYVITCDKALLWAILLTALWFVASFAPPGHKGLSVKKRLIPVAILLLWSGTFYLVFFGSSYIEDKGYFVSSFKPQGSYRRNGSALSFVITARNSFVKKPDGYNVEEIEKIANIYTSDKVTDADNVTEHTPNIIIIMNESFSDMAALGEIETSEDYIPFYRSLQENTVRTWMSSSVFGGSTANSEFECLTGFSMRFLPYMSVPFRSIIKEETPSFTDSLKEMGYGGNIAFHPGMRDSYCRDKVYPLLGFDQHISYEDLTDPDKIRDFVSDEYDYSCIEREFEKFRSSNADRPFYMFNVTIQNHGGYYYSTGVVDSGVEILSPDLQY